MSDRLTQIETRVKAAYPGPWFWNSYSGIFSGTCRITGRHHVSPEGYNGCPVQEEHDDDCTPVIAWVPSAHGDTAGPQDGNNADFIAHSREDIEWLLAEVRRLKCVSSGGQSG